MSRRIISVLLNSNSEGGGGGSEGESTPAVATPQSDQIATFKGSPASPMEKVTPMPESLKGTSFNLDDGDTMLDYKGQPDAHDDIVSKEFKDDVKKVEKKEEVKTEEKKDEPEKKEETKSEPKKFKAGLPEKPVAKVETKVEGKPGVESRDYSWAPEDQREHLKKTSNEAFEYIRKVHGEHKAATEELQKLKPEIEAIQKQGFPLSWSEHPEAWRLHPDAIREINKADKISLEEQHWLEQIELIEAGKPFHRITGYDQNGSPVYSEAIEPTEEHKRIAIGNAAKLTQMKQQTYFGINKFAQSFRQQTNELNATIEKFIEEQWPWWKDEKHEAQKDVREFMQTIPPIIPSETLKRVAALMYASYQRACVLIDEMKGETQKKEVITETKKSVEPRTSAPTPSVSSGVKTKSGTPKTFDLEGMMT